MKKIALVLGVIVMIWAGIGAVNAGNDALEPAKKLFCGEYGALRSSWFCSSESEAK